MSETNEPSDIDGMTGQDNQFVTFALAGEMFAVPMGPVQEIIRVPEVARLPLAPPTLDGLANLRGRVLPIINLRRLFNCESLEHDDATRAVVINLGQSLGFVVDRVSSVLSVEKDEIESASSIQSIVSAEYLTGVIKRDRSAGGQDLLMILDFAKLVESEFACISKASHDEARMTSGNGLMAANQPEAVHASDELRLVSFSVAQQEYAIDIASVQEIVQVPDHITALPNVGRHVLGVISLRQRLLPLVSLRALFGLQEECLSESHRIVVIALPGGHQVGLVTDAVKEVLSVPRAQADNMPSLMADDHSMHEFSSICRLEDGKRLVSVIATERLLSLGGIREAVQAAEQSEDRQANQETTMSQMLEAEDTEAADDDIQVVIFRLGAEEFGVPIMSVQEIVRVPECLTKVPKTPSFVEGVINLRGTVLPVIDQRTRLGMGAIERNDRQRIMVYLLGGMRTGFIVDAVAEVLRIPKAQIAPAPEMSDEQSRLIRQVAKLDGDRRLVLLIEPQHLLQGRELSDLGGDAVGQLSSADLQRAA